MSHAPRTHRRASWTSVAALCAAVAAVAYLAGVGAVHDVSLFELDRNVMDSPGGAPDWENVYNASLGVGTVGFVSAFTHDEALPDSIFGQAKDTLPISQWTCTTGSAGDKDDVLHAYATIIPGPDGSDAGTDPDTYIYFGAERFAASGTANIGIWLFQQAVGCSGSSTFTGAHVAGDLLIVSEFTNGGAVSTIKVYKWEGGANGALNSTPVLTGVDCLGGASAGDGACATVNNATIATPWPTQTKTGAANTLPAGHLFEGGANINSFFANLANFRCFSNFVTETRASAALTASLIDFSLQSFRTCDARIHVSPATATNPVGTEHTITALVEENTGTGFGNASGEQVNFTISSGPGSFVGGTRSCTTDSTGQCSVRITSQASGTTVVDASVDVHIGESILPRTTNGTSGNSGPASKTWTRVGVGGFRTTSSPSGGGVVPGTSASDTASLDASGGLPTPTGSVAFFLCQPGEVTGAGCPSGGSQVGSAVSLSGGQATSASTASTTAIGTHCWRAEYGGDATYAPASHTDRDAECFTTVRQSSTTSTQADPGAGGIVPGTSARDTATVAGGAGQPTPTGSVSFFLCQPGEVTPEGCPAGSGTQVGSAVSLSGGQATSASTTSTTAIGTYCWRAEYGGDAFYLPSGHTDHGAECFTTVRQAPGSFTTLSDPSATAVDPGTPARDTATLDGGAGAPTPTGSVSFFLCQPGEVNSEGCPAGSGTQVGGAVSLSGGQATSASSTDTTAAGTYCWRAEYDGDGIYLPASHTDHQDECFLVKASSTTTTTPSSASVTLGDSVTDGATVSGDAGTPTGTVSFFVCSPSQLDANGECSIGGTSAGTKTLVNGEATSDSVTPTSAGTWCFRAEYGGDGTYLPSGDHRTSECATVDKAASTTATQVSYDSFDLGASVSDAIRVDGLPAPFPEPTGSVHVTVTGPGGPYDLTNYALDHGRAGAAFTPSRAGDYCFHVVYGGDANYLGSEDDGDRECFTVRPGSTATSTSPSAASIAFGGSNADTASVTGNSAGGVPTGSVTFFLCGPSELDENGECSAGGSQVGEPVGLDAQGRATSASVAPTGAGTWCFRGEYGGDSNYRGSADHGTGECFRVNSAPSTTDTTPDEGSVVLGGSNADHVTVTGAAGAATPTGSVAFFVCAPEELDADGVCSSGGSALGTESLDTSGQATSDAFESTHTGTWCFRGEYGGDGNYDASSDFSSAECFSVTSAPSRTATAPDQGSVVLGGSNSDHVTVTGAAGAAMPTGSVAFFVCAPEELDADGVCSSGGSSVSTEPLDANGQGTSDAFEPTHTGTWCFRGEYGGDGNYDASSDFSSAECFSVTSAPSRTATAPEQGSVVLGGSNADHVTVTGAAGAAMPTGSVAFFVCAPEELDADGVCSSGGSSVSTEPLDANGQGTSDAFEPTHTGTWCFRGEYGGDGNYDASSDFSSAECFSVTSAPSRTATAPEQGSVVLGGSNADHVTVTGAAGAAMPTGSVAFFVCAPEELDADGVCSSGGSSVGTESLDANGQATSDAFEPTHTGTWCFRGEYGGDGNYDASSDFSSAECFSVTSAPSRTATAPDQGSVVLGGSNSDHVTVTGAAGAAMPTGSVAFFVCAPEELDADGVCSSGGSSVSTESLDANGQATSDAFEPTHTGTWCFRGEYGGDGNYDASSDFSSAECFSVTSAPSRTATAPDEGSIVLGGSNADHVTVTGAAGAAMPTGSVAFFVCAPEELDADGVCSSGGSSVGTEPLDANGQATSDAFEPTHTGTWCFRGEYGGDGNYDASSDFSSAECFSVTSAPSRTATAPDQGSVVLGGSNADHVTVTGAAGAATPTGSVAFFVCAPDELDSNGECLSGGSPVSSEPLDANGEATSDAFQPTSAGTWCFRGEYGGDTNYDASVDQSTAECFTVEQADSRTATMPGDATITLGQTNTDQATVTGVGGVTPTGSVAFFLCGPSELDAVGECGSGGALVSTEALDASGQATSDAATPTSAGTWCFRGEYGGDANYRASTDHSTAECFTVVQADSLTATTPGSPSITLGESNTDSAAVSGNAAGGVPTGSVTFFLCGPSGLDANGECSAGGSQVGEPVGLDAQGRATSASVTPTSAGTWCFRGEYGGDGNYRASTDHSTTECFAVARAASRVATSPASASITFGGSDRDDARVGGNAAGGVPTGTVAFFVCSPSELDADGECSSGGSGLGSVALDGQGQAASPAFSPTSAGTWCFRGEYGGDANYLPGADHSTAECFRVDRAAPAVSTASQPTGGNVVPGSAANDTASVGGVQGFAAPTGDVSFFLCGPSASTPDGCPSGGTQVGGAVPLSNGQARSSTTTATLDVGTYCWRAEYGGDGNYAPRSHTNNGTECFTVVRQAAGLTTQSRPTGRGVPPGQPANDTANVTGQPGLPAPTGTVSFFLCAPGEVTAQGCPSGGTQVGGPVGLSGSGATSDDTSATTALGTYCWRAEYSGDAIYLPRSHTNNGTECFTVELASPTVTTVANPRGGDVGRGSEAYDTAVVRGVSGRPAPTGTVRFFLCQPAQTTSAGCASGGAQVGGAVPLGADGLARSGTTVNTQALGKHCWRAEYSGDTFYRAASHTNPDNECFTTTPGDICTEGPAPDFCTRPTGPAACSAFEVWTRVAPSLLAPRGVEALVSPSSAVSAAYGHDHGEAHVAGADVPSRLAHSGTAETSCDTDYAPDHGTACGTATAENLTVDLAELGLRVNLTARLIHEAGCTFANDGGFNDAARLENLVAYVNGARIEFPVRLSGTRVDLSPLVTVWINEHHQDVNGGCNRNHGDWIRVWVYDPVGRVPPAAEVIVGWVSTLACPIGDGITFPVGPASTAPPAPATSACAADGLTVRVMPGVLSPRGLVAAEAPSAANATSMSGHGHGDASLVDVDVVPGVARARALASSCDADAGAANTAAGEAEVLDLAIDTRALGADVQVTASALREEGSSTGGAGANGANIAGLRVVVLGTELPLTGVDPADPNTVIALGDLGYLELNGQHADPGPCGGSHGSALRLVLFDPGGTAEAAEIAVSPVATRTC
jgi:hypothetical protein